VSLILRLCDGRHWFFPQDVVMCVFTHVVTGTPCHDRRRSENECVNTECCNT
jgi:hypothetical protein